MRVAWFRVLWGVCGPALLTALACLLSASPARAAAPSIRATWSTGVTASSANLRAEVNPGGLSTNYHFQYLTRSAYLAGGESFSGAVSTPETFLGFGNSYELALAHVGGLTPSTAYEYRVVATNSASPPGGTPGKPRSLTTQESSPAFGLPDARGWEMVSPAEKNGGAIQGFGQNRGGGVLQAAAQGGAITYSSASSFAEGPEGAPPASQYVSRRTSSGWTTENVTAPTLSGVYGTEPIGVPYRIFSEDLARGLMLNGVHCRGEGTGCPVDAPVLTGSGALAGYQDYYLRDSANGSFTALLSESDDEFLRLEPEQLYLGFAGASPDLAHVVLSTCAKLTANASEAPGGEGCDPTKPNLYEWSGGGLSLVNVAPGAALAAPSGAISADGARVYFVEAGKLYLREGANAPQLLAEGGEFQTATPSGSMAFYTKAGHLYRYDAVSHSSSDLTPAGGVAGVLGASADGSVVYFQNSSGIERWESPGTLTPVAVAAAASQKGDWPPATGAARVSSDGEELLFVSKASLTGFDNTDQTTGGADAEVFLWQNSGAGLLCVSCNPTEERPLGASAIPGAVANGEVGAFASGELPTDSYKPRVLSANGRRLFFDSGDSLVPGDTNNRPDVYQWEAQGEGSCTRAAGCLALISSGRGADGASFVDASADGSDAFFLTGESLVPADPGSADVYDARVGGGFPEPPPPLECVGDACQPLPQAPEDPTVGTTVSGPGNPPLPTNKRCPKGKRLVVRHGKVSCMKVKHQKHERRKHGGRK
ncbi:MAG: fibronectin type III domain-containing protein [Solirubrobacterales bacterium]